MTKSAKRALGTVVLPVHAITSSQTTMPGRLRAVDGCMHACWRSERGSVQPDGQTFVRKEGSGKQRLCLRLHFIQLFVGV